MEYHKFGNTGMDVSKIALGMMSFGESNVENGLFPWASNDKNMEDVFKKAIDSGINYFDTANVYQSGTSEITTGKLIKKFSLNRDDIVVATKVNFPMRPGKPNSGGLSRKEILSEIDHSLERLQLDYVDLYQIHRLDPQTPMEETMEALHDVVKSGKARYIGASSLDAWQLERMQNIAKINGWTKFSSVQPQYNLLYREEEREIMPLASDSNIAVVPWSPLAGGRTARPWEVETERSKTDEISKNVWGKNKSIDKPVVDTIEKISEETGYSMAQISLAWMLSKDYITAPVIGATKIKHIEEAVSSLNIELSKEHLEEIENAYEPHAKMIGY
ncbi:aldo/keto reductase [Staphylococcus sp. SQ8-PEA]|uniref:Aldo/keto reductase n=1 Tax=Staphylococcus marylandisciuri TaxID=2981529 RepID=A0ABT2QQJ8_9STAP|nr:aldo/keto reductase [Staphylococcus marylandisciuri]MCU5746264.1 aldo/keto reductase [Staphylococcus marylandisciuri]